MMNKTAASFLPILLLFFSTTKSEGVETKVSFLSQRPVMDGNVFDDAAWKGIEPIGPFHLLGKEEPATPQTSVKMGVWGDSLYLGVVAFEPEMAKIKAELNDMGDLWMEDSIEVFLLPEGSKVYYQFIINAAGKRFNSKNGGGLPLWDWRAETCKGKDYWSAEISIPFPLLKAVPTGVWKGNVCRNRFSSKDPNSSWAKVKGSFHMLKYWGNLIFSSYDASKSAPSDLIKAVKEELGTLTRQAECFSDRIKKQNKEIEGELSSSFDSLTLGDGYGLLNQVWAFQGSLEEWEGGKDKADDIKFQLFKKKFFKEE